MKKKNIVGLIAVAVIVSVAIFTGCVEEETPVSTPSTVTPTPTPMPISTVTPTPTPTQYPWKSILIREGRAPAGISGNVLEVSVDLGRQLSSNESKTLSEKVKLIDENGREYRPFGRSFGGGATISFFDSEDQVWMSWHADFASGFVFAVQSRSSNYTLSWCDFPPLAVGNPFESPFCLGCVE